DGAGAPVTTQGLLVDRLYTGQRWEQAVRLYDYHARFYEPRIARFLSVDPAQELANPYSYVGGMPTRAVDPSGMLISVPPNFDAAVGPLRPEIYFDLYGAIEGGTLNGQQFSLAGARIEAAPPGASSFLGAAYSIVFSLLAVAAMPAGLAAAAAGAAIGVPIVAFEKGSIDGAFSGAHAGAIYAAQMHGNEVADLAGGGMGHMYGMVKGIVGISKGVASLSSGGDGSQIFNGVFTVFASLVMPRLGSHGGLNWPGTSSNAGLVPGSTSTVNLASIAHDKAVDRAAGFLVASNHFGWIARSWAGPGVQPGLFGNAYRALGTVGFGAVALGLRGLGR
ncbi:MAG: RHS repeat-associated core domain-containing protein, partial [Planctomycetota bacterium]|nr:RHS repeat-associated core domain-containing protein [Planctomycetota bacterium]